MKQNDGMFLPCSMKQTPAGIKYLMAHVEMCAKRQRYQWKISVLATKPRDEWKRTKEQAVTSDRR